MTGMYIFPVQLFNPSDIRVAVRTRVVSGGQALDGTETVIAADGGGQWEITYSGISLHTADQARALDAWLGYMAGGVTTFRVPLVTLATAPRGFTGQHVGRTSALYMDNEEWPTVMRYSAPLIEARVGASAALRATVLNVVMDRGPTPKGGEKLSIGNYAYKLIRPIGGGNYQIEPPLRQAVALNAPIIFDWPMVNCRLRVGEAPAPSLQRGRFGSTELNFVEAF